MRESIKLAGVGLVTICWCLYLYQSTWGGLPGWAGRSTPEQDLVVVLSCIIVVWLEPVCHEMLLGVELVDAELFLC